MTVSAHNILFARFAQTQVLLNVEQQALFEGCIRGLSLHPDIEKMMTPVLGQDDFWPQPGSWNASYRPYVVESGVLKIPVMGVLLNRFGYTLGRYATGYTYIQKAFERGLDDPTVKGIALICDSPGGEVAGCFELSDTIYNGRKTKPVRAFAADHAYSAAYALASSANGISMTRSGGVGSVGVVTAHVDYSKMLNDVGLKVTFIFAGKHKVDGNPYEKLPASVKQRFQARIDNIYGVFTKTVARNRKMDDQAVRDTEALTYDAATALDVGFADKVGVFEDEVAAFADELCDPEEKGPTMATDNTTKADDSVPKATHDATVASARTEGEATGRKGERDRVNAILACDEAKDRPKAALSAALKTDMTVDQAKAFLGDLPAEKATAPAEPEKDKAKGTGNSSFADHMNNTEQPNVGAGGEQRRDGDADSASAATILADYGNASGYKPRKQA